ncbi:hypothetical protein Mapa_011094 [Marchantia paleacea]|nr:hypothetical protein Mapa_011094 [Marchantia paleacea]
MLREFRKVAPTCRTIWGRLTCLRGTGHRSPELPQSFPNACPAVAACDSRDRGATVGRTSCRQNAAYQAYGSFFFFHDASSGLDARVYRACGDSLKDVCPTVAKSTAQAGLVFCPSLLGVSSMDDEIKTPTSLRVHECSPMLAESFYGKKYFTQTRYFSSETAIQTDEKKAVDSGNKDKKTDDPNEKRSWVAKSMSLLSDLEDVPVAALGLGLAGAIPFVGLAPGIASVLPLPECLYNSHMEAQAAYGAIILTFLGGPHWGLAMSGNGVSKIRLFEDFDSNSAIRLECYTIFSSVASFASCSYPETCCPHNLLRTGPWCGCLFHEDRAASSLVLAFASTSHQYCHTEYDINVSGNCCS